jgi:hypothetical protein
MQKILFSLTLIWLVLTVNLAISNHLFQEDADFQLQRRALIVYSRTLAGCMMGSFNVNPNYAFTPTYIFCKTLAFSEKALYLGPK